MSENYVELKTESDLRNASTFLGCAWKHQTIPVSQYFGVAQAEIEKYRRGESVNVFDVAVKALNQVYAKDVTLLDVGASTGHYGEIFRIANLEVDYTGVDFSQAFITLGRILFPGQKIEVADARELPFGDRSFQIVFNSGCLMHIADYETALKETVRVADKFIILHRTPVIEGLTKFYTKEAYGVPCLEIHFGESDMARLFADNSLEEICQLDISGCNHRTYVLERV